jgi:hypothetical protein
MTVSKLFAWIFGMVLALVSAFFVFYTCRLLFVTRFLTAVRPGGQGTYLGFIVFPVIAILSAWAAKVFFRRAMRR